MGSITGGGEEKDRQRLYRHDASCAPEKKGHDDVLVVAPSQTRHAWPLLCFAGGEKRMRQPRCQSYFLLPLLIGHDREVARTKLKCWKRDATRLISS
ncbi:hypothetical protein SESBI_07125 [Sesbania bispinosa]|nr:hypothetical protein SESBI_07125 [Sesbania bispinosa]